MVSVQVWLQSTDQKRNVMEGHLFFFFFFLNSSRTVTHCLCVKKRNSAAYLTIARGKDLAEQMFRSYGCAAAMEFFHLEMKREKKKILLHLGTGRRTPKHFTQRSRLAWYQSMNVSGASSALDRRVYTRGCQAGEQSYKVLHQPCWALRQCHPPPVMSQRIMNMTLKL